MTEKVVGVTISNASMPAFGAYLSPSARAGKAQIVLDFEMIYKVAMVEEEDPVYIASECAVHEILHAMQELLGKAFSESDVERLIAETSGQEVCEDNMELADYVGATATMVRMVDELCAQAIGVLEEGGDVEEGVKIIRGIQHTVTGDDHA